MVKVNTDFHKYVWEFLLSCLQVKVNGGYISDNEKQIIVASPWISDLSNRDITLNTPLYDGVQMKVRKKLYSLSNILIALSDEGFEVIVVTSIPGCLKWKRGSTSFQRSDHRRLNQPFSFNIRLLRASTLAG